MNLQNWMSAVNYQINGGSEYLWQCFGPDMYCLDSEHPNEYNASVLFNRRTQEVILAEVCDYRTNRAYRYFNKPEYAQVYQQECQNRGITDTAWDSVAWTQLETFEDFDSKLRAIVAGEDYDDRVEVPLDLEDELLFELMMQAHRKDITLNQHVENLLRIVIEESNLGKSN